MLLKNENGKVLAQWTQEQYLLVQKFMPEECDLFNLIDNEWATHLFMVERALTDVHYKIMQEFNFRDHLHEKVQLHQAGLLVCTMQDNMMRLGLHHKSNVVCAFAPYTEKE